MLHLSTRDLVLLIALTLTWGFNWPVMKYGVQELAPLYFRTLCIAGGLAVLYAYARAARISLAVPRGGWLAIVKLAIPNAIIWHVLVIIAMKLLPAGRAAILGYTMPVWVVVCGLLFFNEKPTRRQAFGVAAAFAATVLLLGSELRSLAGRPLGAALMLAAAAAWGYGTHLFRSHLREMPALAITFWMLAMTLPVLLALSIAFELPQWRNPDAVEWISIVYNMVLAIAFCHAVWAHLARTLPPVASGLSVMMIPVVGVFSSVWLLGEQPLWQDFAALALTLFALTTVLFRATPAATTRTAEP